MPGTGQGTRPQSDHHNASWPVDVDFGMLPAHIRQFVESAWAGLSGLSAKDMKAQVLAAMAQSEELHAAGERCTNGNCVHSTAQGLPAMPALDPKARALTEKVFAEVLEKIVAAKDEGHTTPGGMVLTGEFAIDEHGVVNGHHHGPDVRLYAEFTSDEEEDGVGDGPDGGGDGVNYDDEGLLGMPGTYTALNGATYISAGEKPRKSRKKKRKPAAEPEPAQKISVAPPVTGRQAVGNGGVTGGVTASPPTVLPPPTTTTSAMPAARTTTPATTTTAPNTVANQTPSSRAAGKQPMAYQPTTTAILAPPNNANPQPRSARAAAKAPAPPSNYQATQQHNHQHHHPSPPSSNASAPQKHRPPGGNVPSAKPNVNNKQIASSSSIEDRERIKEFWLGLGEEERRALVKVEKEAVLRKMKEQQKHNCTCAVCGRKR